MVSQMLAKPKEKVKAKIKELTPKESFARIARTSMHVIVQKTALLSTRNSKRNRKKRLAEPLSHLSQGRKT